MKALSTHVFATFTLAVSNCLYGQVQSKPDALLQIDMNRPAVVERIINSWSKELPAAQLEGMRQKLMGLRADQSETDIGDKGKRGNDRCAREIK